MTGITNKVVVITGASGGMGEATARHLGDRGAKLVLGARRSDRLEALVQELSGSGVQAVWKAIDVRRRADVEGLVALAEDQFGRLDVMINNAGVGPISALDALKVDDWEEMIDVNLKGTLYGIAAALPLFRAQAAGQFVNVLSTAGLRIAPMQSVYAGTKNAVRAISEGLRQEAGPNLRVTVISPGLIRTGFSETMTDPDVRATIETAMAKIAISPDAIARAIAFAIEQPADVDVGEIVIRPTAQA